MNLTRISAIAMIAWLSCFAPLGAQSLKNVQAPAEFPPSSFKGKQYIDSRGCVFIRAGIGGETTWVPRVTRSRKLICGQKPTFDEPQVAEAAAPRKAIELTLDEPSEVVAPAPVPAPARRVATPRPDPVTQVTAPKAEATPRATDLAEARPRAQTQTRRVVRVQRAPEAAPAATQPTTRPVAQVAPAPEQTRRVVVRAPQPKRVVAPARTARVARAPQALAPLNVPVRVIRGRPEAPAPAQRTELAEKARPACAGLSPVSAKYVNSGKRYPVRCGPQTGGYGTSQTAIETAVVAKGGGGSLGSVAQPQRRVLAGDISPDTRIVPRHVYEERQNTRNVRVPHGYTAVWQDDRLNPLRAEQSLAGDSDMKLVWTSTLPRRLIDENSGRDVTAQLPLIFPFTNLSRQKQELGTVKITQRDGVTVKRVTRNARAKAKGLSVAQPVAAERAKLPAVAKPTTAKARYVQVGVFDNAESARRAAGRLQAAGLTVRKGTFRRNGQAYQRLVLGPYAGNAGLEKALRIARARGFSGAFIRN